MYARCKENKHSFIYSKHYPGFLMFSCNNKSRDCREPWKVKDTGIELEPKIIIIDDLFSPNFFSQVVGLQCQTPLSFKTLLYRWFGLIVRYFVSLIRLSNILFSLESQENINSESGEHKL